jgi:hypothetical protein
MRPAFSFCPENRESKKPELARRVENGGNCQPRQIRIQIGDAVTA